MPVHYLLDIDDTLVFLGKKDGSPIYNEALIGQLKGQDINYISLLSAKMSFDPQKPNRAALIAYLKKREITVDKVIYPYDVDLLSHANFQQAGMGVSHTQFLKRIEEAALLFESHDITQQIFNAYKDINDAEAICLFIQYLINNGLYKPEDTLDAILQDLKINKINGLNKIQNHFLRYFTHTPATSYPFDLNISDLFYGELAQAKDCGMSTLQNLLDRKQTVKETMPQKSLKDFLTSEQVLILHTYFARKSDFMSTWYVACLTKSNTSSTDKSDAYLVFARALTDKDSVVFIGNNEGHREKLMQAHSQNNLSNQLFCLKPVQPKHLPRDQHTYMPCWEFESTIDNLYYEHELRILKQYKTNPRYQNRSYRGKDIATLIDNVANAAEIIKVNHPADIRQTFEILRDVIYSLENPITSYSIYRCRLLAERAQGSPALQWQILGAAIMALSAALAVLGVLVITGTVGVAALPGAGLIAAGIGTAVFAGGGALALYGRQKGFSKAITTLADSLTAEAPTKAPDEQFLVTAKA